MFQPSASLMTLRARAQLLQQLREFFVQRRILEVDVPALGDATVTDIHLQPLVVQGSGAYATAPAYFLQTSPEYYMKRLLAAGSGSIYYLGKAYRSDESGRRHRPEFTMLEWYCVAMDDRQLMAQMEQLFRELAPDVPITMKSYGDVFSAALDINPHTSELAELQRVIDDRVELHTPLTTKNACLDLLFTHCIEPRLPAGIIFIHDYPQEQCALSRTVTDDNGIKVARRFEVYWDGLELANGYWELTSATEQRQRFEADQQARVELGLPVPELDDRFLAALAAGLPDCAGVALGVDRLLMCLLGAKDIRAVMPFADR